MQNKHQKISFLGGLTSGEGGGPPVGPKDQLFPFCFVKAPLRCLFKLFAKIQVLNFLMFLQNLIIVNFGKQSLS